MALSSNETPSDSPSITESQRQRILSLERRRILLDILAEQATPLDINSLALAIGEVEQDRGTPDSEEITQIAVELHHCHLPQLDEVGIVDYDPTANRVTSFQGRIRR